MATVTGFTAARMLEIEDSVIDTAEMVGDNLHLITKGGDTIDAGSARGPQGLQGTGVEDMPRGCLHKQLIFGTPGTQNVYNNVSGPGTGAGIGAGRRVHLVVQASFLRIDQAGADRVVGLRLVRDTGEVLAEVRERVHRDLANISFTFEDQIVDMGNYIYFVQATSDLTTVIPLNTGTPNWVFLYDMGPIVPAPLPPE